MKSLLLFFTLFFSVNTFAQDDMSNQPGIFSNDPNDSHHISFFQLEDSGILIRYCTNAVPIECETLNRYAYSDDSMKELNEKMAGGFSLRSFKRSALQTLGIGSTATAGTALTIALSDFASWNIAAQVLWPVTVPVAAGLASLASPVPVIVGAVAGTTVGVGIYGYDHWTETGRKNMARDGALKEIDRRGREVLVVHVTVAASSEDLKSAFLKQIGPIDEKLAKENSETAENQEKADEAAKRW
jgi:hypothetical protein